MKRFTRNILGQGTVGVALIAIISLTAGTLFFMKATDNKNKGMISNVKKAESTIPLDNFLQVKGKEFRAAVLTNISQAHNDFGCVDTVTTSKEDIKYPNINYTCQIKEDGYIFTAFLKNNPTVKRQALIPANIGVVIQNSNDPNRPLVSNTIRGVTDAPISTNASEDEIFTKDTITCGPSCFVKIKFNNESLFFLGPKSQISVEQHLSKVVPNESSIFNMAKGVLRAFFVTKNPAEPTIIKTPTVALGVRGTEIIVDVNVDDPQNPVTTVVLLAGSIEVGSYNIETKKIEEIQNVQKSYSAPAVFKVVGQIQNDVKNMTITQSKKFDTQETDTSKQSILETIKLKSGLYPLVNSPTTTSMLRQITSKYESLTNTVDNDLLNLSTTISKIFSTDSEQSNSDGGSNDKNNTTDIDSDNTSNPVAQNNRTIEKSFKVSLTQAETYCNIEGFGTFCNEYTVKNTSKASINLKSITINGYLTCMFYKTNKGSEWRQGSCSASIIDNKIRTCVTREYNSIRGTHINLMATIKVDITGVNPENIEIGTPQLSKTCIGI